MIEYSYFFLASDIFWSVVFKIHGMVLVKPMIVLGLFVSYQVYICFEESRGEKSTYCGFSGHWHGQGPLPVFDRAPSSPEVVNPNTPYTFIF